MARHAALQSRVEALEAQGAAAEAPTKYVPPHLRQAKPISAGLKKTVNQLCNRLSEATLENIIGQLQSTYERESRNEMNTLLCNTILAHCCSSVQVGGAASRKL